MIKATRHVYEQAGLKIAELNMDYVPERSFSVDALVTAVKGLYNGYGEDNPWRGRTDAEWAWTLNRHSSTHYAAVEDVGEIAQPEKWLAYANVFWHGDSAIPQRDRVFQSMIHVPTDTGRRAVRAILAADAARQTPSWTGDTETYERHILLDVPELGLDLDLMNQGNTLQEFGDKGQQIARKRVETP